MATNKLGKKQQGQLARELESIRDVLTAPTQIPLLEDVVNDQEMAAPAKKNTGKTGRKPAAKRKPTESASRAATEFKLEESVVRKLRAASDKVVDDLVKEYSKKMAVVLRAELGTQLESILNDIQTDLNKHSQ